MTQLQQAILTPVVFFDLFDRPIRYSALSQLAYGHKVTDTQISATVSRLQKEKKLVRRGEFVALAGRGGLVANALLRDQLSDALWAEATTFILSLGSVPFVRMIAVINSLSFHNANANSDIDLLIVTEPGKMAVARDHISAKLTLWRRRNTSGPKRGKLAADVFIDTDHLNVHSFRRAQQDIYLDYWAAWVAPVINRDQTFERFMEQNSWLCKTFPGLKGHSKHIAVVPSAIDRRRRLWEAWYRSSLGSRVSAQLTYWQHERLKRYQAKVKDRGTVVLTPYQMRFHIPDRRAEYQQAFEDKWRQLITAN